MLTPLRLRLKFVAYWILGLAMAYGALFFNVNKYEFSAQFTLGFAISAVAFFIFGYISLKNWFLYEDMAQRGASILMQTNKQPPDIIYSELKDALDSESFLSSIKNGLLNSKWCIHNDTNLSNAELRVEIDFPDDWFETHKLWCATGLIAGSLPSEYQWGSTGRQRTKVVLTVKPKKGTTAEARMMAQMWINVLKCTLCGSLTAEMITESYTRAEVPNSVLNSEMLILNPPAGKWSVISKLSTQNIILKIGKEEDSQDYYVCIADENNSRTDHYKEWRNVVSTWASFPEVKEALLEKFRQLRTVA